jgi:RNA polymerase sigma-70 factor (ECF subfamily)
MDARRMTESARRPRPVAVRDSPRGRDSPCAELRTAFRAHHASVYTTAHRILGDASDAEDITQIVFETLARRGETLRDPERLGGFLKSCAVRQCLMLLRRRRWWLGRRGTRARTAAAPESGTAEIFVVAAVRELLARLSPEERTAVVLKLVEEHSHEEVAALMGISVATARRRLLEHARDDVQRDLVAEMEVDP